MHQLWDVWKNPVPFTQKDLWLVQFPKGRMSFPTKRLAAAMADGMRKSVANRDAGTY